MNKFYFMASISFNNTYWDSLLYRQVFPHANEATIKSKSFDSFAELSVACNKFIKHHIHDLDEANNGSRFVSFWKVNPKYSHIFGTEQKNSDEIWPIGEVVQYHIVDNNILEEIKKENNGAIVSSFMVSVLISDLEHSDNKTH